MLVLRLATEKLRLLLSQGQRHNFSCARGGMSPEESAPAAPDTAPRSPVSCPSNPNRSQSPQTVRYPSANRQPPGTRLYPLHHSSLGLRWTFRSLLCHRMPRAMVLVMLFNCLGCSVLPVALILTDASRA